MAFSEDKERTERQLRDLVELGLHHSAPPTGADELLLGRIALERQLLTPEQLDECLRALAASSTPERTSSLGKILVQRSYIKPDDLVDLVQEQAKRTQGIPSIPRYEIQDRLGEGATAIVVRAWDRELKRPVAIKVLRLAPGLNETADLRFQREAATAAGISHPNVVSVYDVGQADGKPYLVMELVEGRPLSAVLREKSMDERAILVLLEKAARGVAAAHAKGVVHRDLKPDNIIITLGGEPKVGDFGLAHVADPTMELTRTGAMLGTPHYMAPEQVEGRSKEVRPATDVYALGTMLYETVVGRPPFSAETVLDMFGKIVRDIPAAPRSLHPNVAADLETIVLKCLEKDPALRYATAAELADDLGRYLAGEPIAARPPGAFERFRRRMARQRTAVVVVLGAALAIGGLVLRPARPAASPLPGPPPPPAVAAERPWRPIFDGQSLSWLTWDGENSWRVRDGALTRIPGMNYAGQTVEAFEDGEIRIRFSVQDAGYLTFSVRQGEKGTRNVDWSRSEARQLEGKDHELIFYCAGDLVTAVLDGFAIPVKVNGQLRRRGQIQFTVKEGELRITSVDYRPLKP